MVDAGWLGNIIKTFGPTVAGWAIFCGMLVHWWKLNNERKRDLATEKSGDWARLRGEVERLDSITKSLWARVDELQEKVNACEEREGEWMKRAIAAEATLLGRGKAKQEAAQIVAAERLHDRDEGNGQ